MPAQPDSNTDATRDTVWILVNVYQNDLQYVHMGDDVAITTDAYPDTFTEKFLFCHPRWTLTAHAPGPHRHTESGTEAEKRHVCERHRASRKDWRCVDRS